MAEAIAYSSAQYLIEIEGIRTVTPLVGSGKTVHNYFVEDFWSSGLVFTNNVFTGIAFKFGPTESSVRHALERNVFLGNGKGTECASSTKKGVCPDMYMVEFGNADGQLDVVGNVFHGAFLSAIHITRPCSGFHTFSSNVALSSFIGVSIQGDGCSSLNVQAHRNSMGVVVGDVGSVSNIVAVENGFGLIPAADWDFKPQEFFTPNLDLHADLTLVEDSIFVGVLLGLQDIGFQTDCDSWTGVEYGFEEYWVSFRDWDYTGIQRGAFGGNVGDRIAYDVGAVDGKWLEVRRCAFVAYSNRTDECTHRQGVAISNEASIVGRGSGKASTRIGSPVCYQTITSGLSWVDTPANGRLAFSRGNGGTSGLQIDECGPYFFSKYKKFRRRDYGYCTLFDEDGTLYGMGSGMKLYKANVSQEWPSGVMPQTRSC